MCRGCYQREQGGGRREWLPANSPVGKGEEWEGHSGPRGWGRHVQEEGRGSRAIWEITRDGRRQETEGIGVSFQQEKEGRREWLEAEEARREGKCW